VIPISNPSGARTLGRFNGQIGNVLDNSNLRSLWTLKRRERRAPQK
jgi:hypothetical protein